ncbi:MAG: ParB N-terminal domain-containing protein [Myxococcaceae bacterium]
MNLEENNDVPAQPEASAQEQVDAADQPAATPILLLPPPSDAPAEFVGAADAVEDLEAPPLADAATETAEEPSDSDRALDLRDGDDVGDEAAPEADALEENAAPVPDPEPELEVPRIKRHNVAPALIALDRIDEDTTFRMRPEGDLSQLATDIARLGQLFPVDIRFRPPDRFQVICGFRRVAALRFLQRDRVLARLHTDLSDEDALLMALVSAIHARPVTAEELAEVKTRLEGEGRLTPAIRNMLEKAIAPEDDLAPETVDGPEQEIDAEELASDVTFRLGEINQDLSLLADAFDSLDDERKDELLQQLRYSSELVAYLEGRR